eukprot:31326-Pelagococcus_subviridis.AAC.3
MHQRRHPELERGSKRFRAPRVHQHRDVDAVARHARRLFLAENRAEFRASIHLRVEGPSFKATSGWRRSKASEVESQGVEVCASGLKPARGDGRRETRAGKTRLERRRVVDVASRPALARVRFARVPDRGGVANDPTARVARGVGDVHARSR